MEQLLRSECVADELNWVATDGISAATRVRARLRYRAVEVDATAFRSLTGALALSSMRRSAR